MEGTVAKRVNLSLGAEDWLVMKALGRREGRKPMDQLRWLIAEGLKKRKLDRAALIAEFEAAQAAGKKAS